MSTRSVLVGVALLMAAAPARSRADETMLPGDPDADAPHARAPYRVSLEIAEGTLLKAPDAWWFEAQAEIDPGRFSYEEQAVEITEDGQGTGKYEAGWVDSQDEYVFLYDEDEEEVAYWKNVSAQTLTLGRRDFVQFCAACHGLEGDGYGRSAQHLRPPPRAFTQGLFKFTKVIGDLPSDEALLATIKRGLDGTPMYEWDLSDEQLADIIQYIKSLSPPETGWRDIYAEVGDVVETGEDPWTGRENEAVTRGEAVYHGVAACHNCHPGYATPARLNEITGAAPGTAVRDDLTYPVLKESSYAVLGEPVQIFPPDFTWHTLRSGSTPRDLYQTIATGIPGTAMPRWKQSGGLPDDDIWAMAHYVGRLITDYKGQTAKRAAFMASLRGDD